MPSRNGCAVEASWPSRHLAPGLLHWPSRGRRRWSDCWWRPMPRLFRRNGSSCRRRPLLMPSSTLARPRCLGHSTMRLRPLPKRCPCPCSLFSPSWSPVISGPGRRARRDPVDRRAPSGCSGRTARRVDVPPPPPLAVPAVAECSGRPEAGQGRCRETTPAEGLGVVVFAVVAGVSSSAALTAHLSRPARR